MTKDNAIFTLEYYKLIFASNEKAIEAFDMAISALEREPSISGDGTLIVKVEDGSKVGRVFVSGDDHFGGLYYSDQEPCRDCISKQAVLDVLAKYDNDMKSDVYNEIFDSIDKLSPVNSEDIISRKAVIDSLHNKFADGFDYDRWWNSMSVLYAINKVPPVNTPEKTNKTGHWIDDGQYAEGHSEHVYRCSECGKTYIGYIGTYKECPDCGAKVDELTRRE